MREISCDLIKETVAKMCIQASLVLNPDVEKAILDAKSTEKSELGKKILEQLDLNMVLAKKKDMPICQDTGMAIFFIKLGQEVHITGGSMTDAINEGVSKGYTEGYLRKSVVSDPILRVNTNDNTPAVIYYDLVPGDQIEITMMAKGFGSENCSKVYMLKPADGYEGVKNAVIQAVKDAGPNACPPMFIGVGVGGTFEKAALLSKEALARDEKDRPTEGYVCKLEKELMEEINKLNIGPAGLGGTTTALKINVLTYATHIAGLPMAVNICCHVNRHVKVTL